MKIKNTVISAIIAVTQSKWMRPALMTVAIVATMLVVTGCPSHPHGVIREMTLMAAPRTAVRGAGGGDEFANPTFAAEKTKTHVVERQNYEEEKTRHWKNQFEFDPRDCAGDWVRPGSHLLRHHEQPLGAGVPGERFS